MPTPDLMSQLQSYYAAHPGAVPMGIPSAAPPMYPGAAPSMYAPQQFNAAPALPQFVTADQVRAIVQDQIKAATPVPDLSRLQAVLHQVGDLAKRALPADDYKAMQEYIAGGGQGFADMVAGDALYPIMQLLWDAIKENKK